MSALNPYAKYLDGGPVEQILGSTAAAIAVLLESMDRQKTTATPAPGKWSPVEIVAHLADCDLAFGFRLRQTLAEEAYVAQPFDQERWAGNYSGITAAQALAAFTALRHWNLLLITKMLPKHADKVMTHPERGTMTFRTLVEIIAGHDLNHLVQLRHIAAG